MAKYQEIYQSLLGQIENGEYPAGSCLPGEFELMDIYQVSRDTVRKALSRLAEAGYIQKAHGKGSIVLDINRIEFPVSGIVSFRELAPSLGGISRTEVIALEKTHPDQRIGNILQLQKKDEIWLLQRIRYIDNDAVILDTDFINATIVPDLPRYACEESLYDYLEKECGLAIAYAEKEITCQNVTNMDKRWLNMHGYNMVVNVDSRTYLENAKIFQYTSSRHRPDKFRFKDFARRYSR